MNQEIKISSSRGEAPPERDSQLKERFYPGGSQTEDELEFEDDYD